MNPHADVLMARAKVEKVKRRSEACPECVFELDIKRKEVWRDTTASTMTAVPEHPDMAEWTARTAPRVQLEGMKEATVGKLVPPKRHEVPAWTPRIEPVTLTNSIEHLAAPTVHSIEAPRKHDIVPGWAPRVQPDRRADAFTLGSAYTPGSPIPVTTLAPKHHEAPAWTPRIIPTALPFAPSIPSPSPSGPTLPSELLQTRHMSPLLAHQEDLRSALLSPIQRTASAIAAAQRIDSPSSTSQTAVTRLANPYARHTAQAPADTRPERWAQQRDVGAKQRIESQDAEKASAPPDIMRRPNPYWHAPFVPMDTRAERWRWRVQQRPLQEAHALSSTMAAKTGAASTATVTRIRETYQPEALTPNAPVISPSYQTPHTLRRPSPAPSVQSAVSTYANPYHYTPTPDPRPIPDHTGHVVRSAIRMDKNTLVPPPSSSEPVRDAAAAERGVRRQRSGVLSRASRVFGLGGGG